jgi:hypothetical protein
MKSYTLIVWLACVDLECVLLVRAWVSEWFRKYPFFFAYLACVFIQDVFFLAVYLFNFRYYTPLYWYAEFFSLLIGCGVSWEIFRLVLGRYPGAGRMARNVLLFALIMVITKDLGNFWSGDVPWPSTAVELERNLRAIQAVSLIVLALLIFYYVVPISRNVKGILTGYGLFIAASVVTLALRASLGKAFQPAWVFLQPLCYAGVLFIWCGSLWKYEPAPVTQLEPKIEEDYRSLALVTRKGLLQVRAYLGKSMRP